MSVPVVNIREMRMLVDDDGVLVPMIMGIATIPLERVLMLMVRIMHVRMAVLERLMHVFVLMMLGQVQPHAPAHQAGSHPERRIGRFTEQAQRYCCADERGGRK